MNKIELAKILLVNTSECLKNILEEYIDNPKSDNPLDMALKFIQNDGYDISGFGLTENPAQGYFIFSKGDEWFDIAVGLAEIKKGEPYKNVAAMYYDNRYWTDEKPCNLFPAPSIKEAIEKYRNGAE